jgi:3-oxoacyl-[acyl-carrier-protein] synthase III
MISRRKALPGENTNTMGIETVRMASERLPYPLEEIDLIIGATYTPYDTVATLAHYIQHAFTISNAKAFTISSACSSFINALEIVQGYFCMKKSDRALIVSSEHNSAYNDETNEQSGHLWGDGAAAVFLSREKSADSGYEVLDITTKGLGHVGKSIEGVMLRPLNGGIKMPNGKDVFINANNYMISTLEEILKRNHLGIGDIDYVVPHQANMRIVKFVQEKLRLPDEKMLINLDTVGNTGCASTPIVFSQNQEKFKKGDLIALTVVGGGYSSGAALLRKL